MILFKCLQEELKVTGAQVFVNPYEEVDEMVTILAFDLDSLNNLERDKCLNFFSMGCPSLNKNERRQNWNTLHS